jgi:tRNA 2-selenouridine synthase
MAAKPILTQFSADLPQVSDLRALLLAGTPLLDVRAPVEFAHGALPGAENRPLIDDEERHRIGIEYADEGQDAAIELGHLLVEGERRTARIAAWHDFATRHPDGVLYCFRGGMRSRIAQQWLYEASGIRMPRVRGGYKALRRFLIEEIERIAAHCQPLLIGGRTGVGKTRFIQPIAAAIDLEALAWHRGSAFGRHATPQPVQIDFENRLAIALMRHEASGHRHLILEHEGQAIGSLHLPNTFFQTMRNAPLLLLEATLEERIDNTFAEYVIAARAEYIARDGSEMGAIAWADYLRNSLSRVARRLGGSRYQAIHQELTAALADPYSNDRARHHAWISQLLSDYYDPMYDYQIANNRDRILFQGRAEELNNLLQEYNQ